MLASIRDWQKIYLTFSCNQIISQLLFVLYASKTKVLAEIFPQSAVILQDAKTINKFQARQCQLGPSTVHSASLTSLNQIFVTMFIGEGGTKASNSVNKQIIIQVMVREIKSKRSYDIPRASCQYHVRFMYHLKIPRVSLQSADEFSTSTSKPYALTRFVRLALMTVYVGARSQIGRAHV